MAFSMETDDRRKRLILPGLLLGLITLAVYWPVTGHDFVQFDDPDYVTENRHVQAGLTGEGIRWAFTAEVCGNWHPVTCLSHMLDCQLFGLNATRHHTTNLLLHVANTILLLLVLEQMTRALWRSAFVAALFALHPLHVESVAWVAERKDVLSGLFFLLTLGAYVRYVNESKVQSPKTKVFYALSLVWFALGLMSKPMLVTLPCLLLLLDFWPLRRWQAATARRLLLEKLPFLALTVATSVVTLLTQKQAGAMALMDTIPLTARTANAVVSYGRYVWKTFWPVDLAVFYPLPGAWPAGVVMGAVAFLVLATGLAVWFGKQRPYLAVGWLWFVGMLVPVIGLVQVGLQAMADRYTYLPFVGLFIAVTWGVNEIVSRGRNAGTVLRFAAVLVLAACSVLTTKQIRHWKNSETLFSQALAATSDNAVAHYALGVISSKSGRLDEAYTHFTESVRIKPNQGEALNNLGLLLVMRGKIDEGIERYRQARAAKLDIAELHFNLASALAAKGEPAEAISEFKNALRIKPEFTQAQWALARLQIQQGDLAAAKSAANEALQQTPDNAEAHLVLGLVFAAERDYETALRHLNESARLRPQDFDIQIELADALLAAKWPDKAQAHYRTALQLQPDATLMLKSSAQALVLAGNTAGAIQALERSLRLAGNDADVHRNLALLLVQTGKTEAAAGHFAEVVRLRPDAEAHRNLAGVLILQGQSESAVDHLRAALRQKPDWAAAMNDLAWILATHPKAELRNGAEAVRLGEQACRLTEDREPQFVGTLAAAYAEAGQFDDAIKTGEKARDLAKAAGLPELAARNAQLVEEYRAHKPHREPAGP